MAGADYQTCPICGTRLFYNPWDEDGGPHIQIYTEEELVCLKCYNKLEKKISKLVKASKRGR